MQKRTQLSVILNHAPGERSKLCDVLKAANVNIPAMSIQNGKDSVRCHPLVAAWQGRVAL